jgi:hypothetical protein
MAKPIEISKVFKDGKFVGTSKEVSTLCVAWMAHVGDKMPVDDALNQFLYYCGGERGPKLHDMAVWLLDNGGY